MAKNNYFFLLLLLICFNYAKAQTEKDSLIHLLKNHPTKDTLRCHLLSALVEAEEEDAVWIKYNAEIETISKANLAVPGILQPTYKKFYAYSIYNQSYYYSIYTKYAEAIVCAKKALAIHRELKNNLAIAADLNIIANNSFKIGKIDESVKYYQQGINLSRQIDDKAGIINLYNNVSNVYFSVGDYKKSLEALFEELKVAKQLKSDKDMGDAYASIGGNYGLQGEDKNAVLYFNKAIAIQKKLKNNKGIAFSYQNLGKFYSDRNQFEKAISYFNMALALEKVNEIPQTLIFSSDTYFKMQDYDMALKTLSRALKMSTESNDIENTAVILFQMGRNYFVQQNYNESQKLLERSLPLSQQIKSLKNVQNCADLLYKIYKIQNKDSQSLKMLELSTQINDSLNREENKNTALKTDFKYQTEKKETEIKELTQQKKITQLQSNRKSFLIYSIIGGILALGLLFYFMFNRYKTNKQNELLKVQLSEAEKTIDAEKKASESELKALKSQMNPHFIFNALNGIQEQFMYGDKVMANEQMGNFTYLTRQILTVSGKKQIPVATEIDILTKYLELEKMRFQNHFEYHIHCSDNIDEDYLQIPPMLIQPFVENSIKHGLLHKEGEKKLNIDFDLDEKEECIICTVEDNGIGRQKSAEIKTRNESKHISFSTDAISQRLQLLNQNLKANDLIVYTDLIDAENKAIGTKVTIKIPLNYD